MSYVSWTPDNLFCTMRVMGSTVVEPHGAVLVGGKGIGGFDEFDTDANGETKNDGEAFGAPGIVFRPRSPEQVGDEVIGAEAMSLRMSYGLAPISWRDIRWHRAFPSPDPGTLAFCGYAGSFLAHEDVEADAANWTGEAPPKVKNGRITIYSPYGKDANDVPTKAHVIQLDPSGALQIIQGDGYSVTMDPDNGITLRDASGSAWFKMKGGKVEIVAESITLRGNVALGASPETGLPLMPGPASQPTPSVFFSAT